ncbi:MAG: SDR family oxidoreductase [Planctomycetes bacterium]|nr:SDR family oxidoreductase [Planctomycetota bacterium]
MLGLGLDDSVVLVTGATSGIGAATVAALLEARARVIGFDRTPAAAHATTSREHDGWRFVAGDVTRQSDVDAAVAEALARFGRLDAVVHCAGITDDGVVWKLTDAQWQHVLDVNLTGSFRVVRATLPRLREAGGGAIVLVASINGLRGKFGQANYAASKAGVIALAKTAAIEGGRYGVRVNAVAPGFVRTPMTARLPLDQQQRAHDETPLGRFAEPADIADPILFLCSPLARHVTGIVLRVDGGQCTAA